MTNTGLAYRPCIQMTDLRAKMGTLRTLAGERYQATDDQYYLGIMDAYDMVLALIGDSEAGT